VETKNKKIMIVDDDYDNANLFKIFLENNGYNIDAYTKPIDALNNFRKQRHDLIILDLKMPKMDGITLYQKIKEIDDKVIICLTTADKNFIHGSEKGLSILKKLSYTNPFY
jgi:DNA-binding response OmpR family regulator